MMLKHVGKQAALAAVVLGLSVSAFAADKNVNTKNVDAQPVQTAVNFDSFKEVAYQCQGNKRVLAMYGIKDNMVAGTQIVHEGTQSPLMLRTNNPKYNEFSTSGRHITWTQNLTAPSNLDSTDAKGLTR